MPSIEHDSFTATTVNTHYGRAIATADAARDFIGSDILLMQEVLDIDEKTIARNLGSIGLSIVSINPTTGLAIAVSERFKPTGSQQYSLKPQSKLAGVTNAVGLKPRFRKRGVIVASLETDGQSLAVATASPIVAARPISRSQQINKMSDLIAENFASGPLILGADMNHYPAPNKVDKQMANRLQLKYVDNTDPTYFLNGTKHAWLKHLGLPDGRLDALLYRNLTEINSSTKTVKSDHDALSGTFEF
ncbi:MAG: hypothetical protein WCJ86_00120 [Candidatus Saccharibacteria bacterium]